MRLTEYSFWITLFGLFTGIHAGINLISNLTRALGVHNNSMGHFAYFWSLCGLHIVSVILSALVLWKAEKIAEFFDRSDKYGSASGRNESVKWEGWSVKLKWVLWQRQCEQKVLAPEERHCPFCVKDSAIPALQKMGCTVSAVMAHQFVFVNRYLEIVATLEISHHRSSPLVLTWREEHIHVPSLLLGSYEPVIRWGMALGWLEKRDSANAKQISNCFWTGKQKGSFRNSSHFLGMYFKRSKRVCLHATVLKVFFGSEQAIHAFIYWANIH